MKTIWKYPLLISDRVTLDMPMDAQVLTVQVQHDIACLWVLCDSNQSLVTRHFKVIGTGHPIPANIMEYVGTFQIEEGALVFHVFELI